MFQVSCVRNEFVKIKYTTGMYFMRVHYSLQQPIHCTCTYVYLRQYVAVRIRSYLICVGYIQYVFDKTFYYVYVWYVFNSLVRSILEYCSLLFVGLSKCNSDKFERIMSRFHRILCGDDHKACKLHNFESLDARRNQAALKL